MAATVVITQDLDSIERALGRALDRIDMDGTVRGKRVAVKPNDTWAVADDVTGVTQADTLRAVLRRVKRHQPRELVVTGGAGAAETEDVFNVTGMMEVIRDENVRFVDHNRPPFEAVALDYPDDPEIRGPQKEVMVHKGVLDYEALIALNQLKVHETATVTLALKNVAMSYPAADYYGHPRSTQQHEHAFFSDMHSFIAAMARRFPIGLAVTVGHPAMIGRGPLGGMAVETGLVIASTDAVAADAVGAMLLGFRAQAVRHIWEAGRWGLGETATDEFQYPELSLKEAYQAFTTAAYGRALGFEHA